MTLAPDRPVLLVKRVANRPTFDEARHPRDRLGRFIETGAEVRVGYGRTGIVTSVRADGMTEVRFNDGSTRPFQNNVLTVTKRPGGGAPTSDPKATPKDQTPGPATPPTAPPPAARGPLPADVTAARASIEAHAARLEAGDPAAAAALRDVAADPALVHSPDKQFLARPVDGNWHIYEATTGIDLTPVGAALRTEPERNAAFDTLARSGVDWRAGANGEWADVATRAAGEQAALSAFAHADQHPDTSPSPTPPAPASHVPAPAPTAAPPAAPPAAPRSKPASPAPDTAPAPPSGKPAARNPRGKPAASARPGKPTVRTARGGKPAPAQQSPSRWRQVGEFLAGLVRALRGGDKIATTGDGNSVDLHNPNEPAPPGNLWRTVHHTHAQPDGTVDVHFTDGSSAHAVPGDQQAAADPAGVPDPPAQQSTPGHASRAAHDALTREVAAAQARRPAPTDIPTPATPPAAPPPDASAVPVPPGRVVGPDAGGVIRLTRPGDTATLNGAATAPGSDIQDLTDQQLLDRLEAARQRTTGPLDVTDPQARAAHAERVRLETLARDRGLETRAMQIARLAADRAKPPSTMRDATR